MMYDFVPRKLSGHVNMCKHIRVNRALEIKAILLIRTLCLVLTPKQLVKDIGSIFT